MDDLFDDPSFEEKTMEKLDHYDTIASNLSQKLETHLKSINERSSAPYYKAAEQAWRANPTDNPNVYPGGPITPQVMRAFYAKCDAICDSQTQLTTPAELIRAIFAANIGSNFIISGLLAQNPERPIEYVDMIGFNADLLPQSQQTQVAMKPTSLPAAGDILTYIDKDSKKVQTIIVKDHGYSTIKGRFYVVTTIIDQEMDDDSLDQEVSGEVMMGWVENCIPSQ